MSLFVRGLVIGFAIAAPVGAIGVLCIRRTLAHGRAVGLATGLGAASADAVYGAVAAFGLTAVALFLNEYATWIRIAGGVALLVIGWRTLTAEAPTAATGPDVARVLPAYASAFGLTLTNPTTILSFAAVFAGLGLAGTGSDAAEAVRFLDPLWLVLGVFAGSAAWWLLLSTLVGAVRGRIGPRSLRWVNRVSGAVILGFGAVAIASALVGLGR